MRSLHAIAIAALIASAAPAQAQLVFSNPRVNDGEVRIDPLLCQTDYQIRQSLARAGYSNVFLNAPIGNTVRARGTLRGTVYLIDYDYCLNPGIIDTAPLGRATATTPRSGRHVTR